MHHIICVFFVKYVFVSLIHSGKIFRRDNHTVQHFEDMQRIIRYNDWQHDLLSLNDSGNAIASRYDLEPIAEDRSTFGGVYI